MEIAQYLAAQEAAGKLPSCGATSFFAAWSGEELGLLGSSHFVKTVGGDGRCKARARGRLPEHGHDRPARQALILQGVGSSSVWSRRSRSATCRSACRCLQDDTYLPTDATSFYLAGVPILSPSPAPTRTTTRRATRPTSSTTRTWPRSPASWPCAQDARRRPRRRTTCRSTRHAEPPGQPARLPRHHPGLRGERGRGRAALGVAKGGRPSKGDPGRRHRRELAGKAIENIYDYTYVLDALKIGQPVKVGVQRGGESIELSVTPAPRE